MKARNRRDLLTAIGTAGTGLLLSAWPASAAGKRGKTAEAEVAPGEDLLGDKAYRELGDRFEDEEKKKP